MIGAPENLDGASLVLLLVDDDEGTAMVKGTLRVEADGLHLEHRAGSRFPLPEDTLDRLRPVGEARMIVGEVDYLLVLSIGPLPDDATEIQPTGLRWPTSGDSSSTDTD
ncbi:MAG: hypothetical protein AAGI52_04005 [Bacteroidota bacterium]